LFSTTSALSEIKTPPNPGRRFHFELERWLGGAWSMIRKSTPSGYDPMGGNWFSEKIMLKPRDEIMIRFNLIGS
jgi:hypothetical protein